MSYNYNSISMLHLPLFLIATILLTTLLTSLQCTTDVSKTNASSSDNPNNAAANPLKMESEQPNSVAETAASQPSSPNKMAADPSPKSPPAGWGQMKLKRIRNSTDAKILGDLDAILARNVHENTDENEPKILGEGSEDLLGQQPPMASKSAPKKEEAEKNEARNHDKSLAENVQETGIINYVDGNEKETSSSLSNKHSETKGKQQQQEGSDSSGSPLTISDGTKISSWKRNLKVEVGKVRGHQQKQQQEADDNRGGNGEIEIVPLPPHSSGHSPAHLSAKSRNHEIVVAETGRHLTKYLSRQHTRTGKSGPLMTPEMTKKESNKFNNNNNNSFNSSPQSSLQIFPLASQGMGHWKVAKSLVSSSVEAGKKVFSKLTKRWRAPAGKNKHGKEPSTVKEVRRNFGGGQEEEDEEDTTEWHQVLRRQRNNNDALGREEVLPAQFPAHSPPHSPLESSNSGGGSLDGKRTNDETSDDEDLKFFTPKGNNSVNSTDDDNDDHHGEEEGSVSKNDLLQTHLKPHSYSNGGGSVVNGSGNDNELISDDDNDDGDPGSFRTPKGSENGVVFEDHHHGEEKGTKKKSSSLSSSLPSGNRNSGEEGDEEDEEQLIVTRRSDHFHSSGNNSAKINSRKRVLNVGNVREHHQQQQGSEGGNNDDDDEIVSSSVPSTGHSTVHSPEGSDHRNNGNDNEIVEEVETGPAVALGLPNSVQQHQQNTSKSGLITTADHHHHRHRQQNERQKGKSSNGKQFWATIRGKARKMSKATKFSKAIKFCKGSCFTDHNNNNDAANKKILTGSEKVVFSKLPSQHGHQQQTKVVVAMEESQKGDDVRKLPSTIDRLFPVSPQHHGHLQVVEDQKERIVAANKEEDI